MMARQVSLSLSFFFVCLSIFSLSISFSISIQLWNFLPWYHLLFPYLFHSSLSLSIYLSSSISPSLSIVLHTVIYVNGYSSNLFTLQLSETNFMTARKVCTSVYMCMCICVYVCMCVWNEHLRRKRSSSDHFQLPLIVDGWAREP